MTAGEVLDVTVRRAVQLFHHANTSRFLLWPLDCGSATLAYEKQEKGETQSDPRGGERC